VNHPSIASPCSVWECVGCGRLSVAKTRIESVRFIKGGRRDCKAWLWYWLHRTPIPPFTLRLYLSRSGSISLAFTSPSAHPLAIFRLIVQDPPSGTQRIKKAPARRQEHWRHVRNHTHLRSCEGTAPEALRGVADRVGVAFTDQDLSRDNREMRARDWA
jgi:hypothetical protein